MSPGIVPVAKALYLCDDAVPDSSSNKIHLVGLFNSVTVEEAVFPFFLGKICAFAQFTDGLGQFAAYVEIVNARTGEALYRTPEHALTFSSRKQLVYANFRIRNCSFPEVGAYLVELYCNRAFVDDRVLRVQVRGEPTDG